MQAIRKIINQAEFDTVVLSRPCKIMMAEKLSCGKREFPDESRDSRIALHVSVRRESKSIVEIQREWRQGINLEAAHTSTQVAFHCLFINTKGVHVTQRPVF